MKKKKWLLLVPIILCLTVFYGYLVYRDTFTDRNPPVIHVPDEALEVSVNAPKGVLLQDVTAEDDVSGDVTNSLVLESIRLLNREGNISVCYAAFDKAGNVSKAWRDAKYNNYRSPRFTLGQPLLYPSGKNVDIFSVISAKDALDGEIPHHIRAMMTEDRTINSAGTYMVQFQVTNSLGDTSTEILPVEVYDAEMYNAALTLKEYLVYLPVGGIFNAKFYPDTFTFRGETYELGTVLPESYTLEITGEVDTLTPGVYPVTYTLTNTEKNEWTNKVINEYIGYSKLIVIVEG
jgi:hypothetical protein